MTTALSPLQDLRDIHLPPPISIWPLAPGWYIVATLSVLLMIGIAYCLCRRWAMTRAKRAAIEKLVSLQTRYKETGDTHPIIIELSMLLRRSVLTAYPRRKVASLEGTAWLTFLDKTSQSHVYSQGAGKILVSAPYQAYSTAEISELFTILHTWIEKNL